jgi:hypothetical protein
MKTYQKTAVKIYRALIKRASSIELKFIAWREAVKWTRLSRQLITEFKIVPVHAAAGWCCPQFFFVRALIAKFIDNLCPTAKPRPIHYIWRRITERLMSLFAVIKQEVVR